MLSSLVFQPVTSSDYSQSSTQPYVRLVAGSSPCDHVTSLLRDRHWLPVKQRVEYKLCMMVHRCLYGDAPSYLADLITPSAAATVRPGFRSALPHPDQLQCHELYRRSETGHSRLLAHVHGTNFHHRFVVFTLLQACYF